MTYIARRFSHEKRVVHLDTGDPTLTLSYNFLRNSGSSITLATLKGPQLTFTRASDAHSFDSSGNFVAVGANDLPRFAHDPDNGNAQLGLLMEDTYTNICLQSSDFTTTWVNINTDEPTTNNTDIFGTSTADEIATTSTADLQFATHQSFTGLTAANLTTVSVHIKTGTNVTFVQLVWDSDGGGTDGCFCNFQLTGAGTAGTVTALAAGTATRARIALTVQGFYHVTITGSIASGTVGRFTINFIDNISAAVFEAADLVDNDSLIACAADVQVSSLINTHIPTTTASVTRAEEFCTTTDVSWVSDSDTHTFVIQYRRDVDFNTQTLCQLDAGNDSNMIRLVGRNLVGFQGYFQDAPAALQRFFEIFTLGDLGINSKMSTTIAEGDQATSFNGATVVTETDTDLILVGELTTFRVGGLFAGGFTPDAFIQTIEYYVARKPNNFLEGESIV